MTLMDAHPHSLAWIGSALASRTLPLGVKEFGQSGNRDDFQTRARQTIIFGNLIDGPHTEVGKKTRALFIA